jgi:uncharacterized protein
MKKVMMLVAVVAMGKGGRPYAVPTNVYDETINSLKTAVERAKMGQTDRQHAFKRLVNLSQKAEAQFTPHADAEKALNDLVQTEKTNSTQYGSRSIQGWEQPPGA